jgi:hypothetical protein
MKICKLNQFKGTTSKFGLTAAAVLFASSAQAQSISNISFETGDLSGWTAGGGTGSQDSGAFKSSGVGVSVVKGMTGFDSTNGSEPGLHSWTVVPYDTYVASLQAGGG